METNLGNIVLKFGEKRAIFLGAVTSPDRQTDRQTDGRTADIASS